MSCCSNSSMLPIGPTGATGPLGYKSVNRTVYVDATYGDDLTGLVERLDKPFQTILEAQNAAELATGNWDIHIFAGDYTDSGLGKPGLNYYFSPNTTVTSGSAIFYDFGVGMTFNVFGYGSFYSQGDSVVLLNGLDSNVLFNCYYAESSAGDTIFRVGRNSSSVDAAYLTVNCITDLVSVVEEPMIKVYAPGSITNINARYCIAPGGFVEMKQQAVGAVVNINTREYTIVTGANHYNCFHAKAGTINITGDIVNPRNSNYSHPDLLISIAGEGITYTGNITSSNTFGVIDNQLSVPLTVNGTMTLTGAGTTSAITITGGTNIINSNITSSRADGAVIELISGLVRVTGIVKNATSIATGHVIYKISGTLILDDAKLVATHASALSIYATVPQNIKIYSAFANRDVSIGLITNIISGTVLYYDTDVE